MSSIIMSNRIIIRPQHSSPSINSKMSATNFTGLVLLIMRIKFASRYIALQKWKYINTVIYNLDRKDKCSELRDYEVWTTLDVITVNDNWWTTLPTFKAVLYCKENFWRSVARRFPLALGIDRRPNIDRSLQSKSADIFGFGLWPWETTFGPYGNSPFLSLIAALSLMA